MKKLEKLKAEIANLKAKFEALPSDRRVPDVEAALARAGRARSHSTLLDRMTEAGVQVGKAMSSMQGETLRSVLECLEAAGAGGIGPVLTRLAKDPNAGCVDVNTVVWATKG